MGRIKIGDRVLLPSRKWTVVRMDNKKVQYKCEFPFTFVLENEQNYKRNYVSTGFTIRVIRLYVKDNYNVFRPTKAINNDSKTIDKDDYLIIGLVRNGYVRIYGIDIDLLRNGPDKSR